MRTLRVVLPLLLLLTLVPGCDPFGLACGREREEVARLREEKRVLEEQSRRQALELQELKDKIDALLVQLAAAKDDATRAALEKQLAAARAAAEAAPKKPCACKPGDPLCACW
jgi:hypothetical protein